MKVLLTGATGFIGSHVARLLVGRGHEVHALVRPTSRLDRLADIKDRLHWLAGDLLDSSFILPPSSFSACLHLAWYVEPGRYLESPLNRDYVNASLRLAEQLGRAGCRRFVTTGTCFEYDFGVVGRVPPRGATSAPSGDVAYNESSLVAPATLYARCKLEFFQKLQQLDMSVAWPRLFYQFGPHEDPRRLVPYIIQSLRRGQAAELTPGEQVRDFLHVEDVACAVVAIAESNLTGAVNVGSRHPVTVRDLAGRIGQILDRPDLLRFGARPYPPGEPMRIVADNRRLRSTGWRPRYDLDSGLRQTIDWWNRPDHAITAEKREILVIVPRS